MKKALSLFLFIMAFTSCSKDNDFEQNSLNPISVDVYVTGQKNGNPCYWKNNQLIPLDNGGFSNGIATKIIVSGADIHVLGITTGRYLYWKNGILINLNSYLNINYGTFFKINDMFIDGNDVYFCGKMGRYYPSKEVCYWKNGMKTVISSNDAGSAQFMIISNNDIYIFASRDINNNSEKGYYINGVFNIETDYSAIYGMEKINNEVYIFGAKNNTLTGSNFQGYYKNITTGSSYYIPNTQQIRNLNGDNNNLYFYDGIDFYTNNNISSFFKSGIGVIDFKILNDNSYVLSIEDTTNVTFYLDINDTNSMQINSNDGEFTSILVI